LVKIGVLPTFVEAGSWVAYHKLLPKSSIERRTYGLAGRCSANWATYTFVFISVNFTWKRRMGRENFGSDYARKLAIGSGLWTT